MLDVSAGGVSMPSLETVSLKRIMATEEAVLQLVSGCSCLADLTLEQCPSMEELVVTSPRLESFSIFCCHNTRHVVLHTELLRTLRYRDGLPGKNFFTIADCTKVLAMTIDICQSFVRKSAPTVTPIMKLITRCTNLTFLHLHLSMAYHSGTFMRALRRLPHLRQLALKGIIKDDQTVRSISTLLRNTPGLDMLSLSLLRPYSPKPYYLGINSSIIQTFI
ncbi:hypothetical protein E2562_035261 [Oryza meyeriana var. granulata]|uniref:At1g61320/AtMIF1 LRR domain-containing protein n=1 Tax=Oryza meyeriana var. granulata TaxID=110450 RepID=A0A6G1C2D2_9ORYZ|nr:hypothetical protein E2562_035261 [Oryza meyeriana var. granulata]